MKSKALLLGLALVLSGCFIGRRAEDLDLARLPRGANVQIQTRSGALNGELLEVQDTAVVVLTAGGDIMLVPYRVIQQSEAELLGGLTQEGLQPSAAHRERLRQISRFPHGMTPEVRRALLAAHAQTEIQVVGQ